ncbi:MAG: TnsA endonuclease N-terminal domain-containing protein [Dehalococcoidia bacterium]
MAISKHGEYRAPQKSPYNFERYQSDLERKMMERLDAEPTVTKWMKRHGISIPWVDSQKHMRRYVPDFIVEYRDGRKALIEVKDPSRMRDSDEVQRKRKAAEIWCKRRGMEYVIMTIE